MEGTQAPRSGAHTLAERRAAEAQAYPAFRHVNLAGLRDSVSTILGLIGRDGPFRDYTLHDISHIDEMLAMLDWLIPAETAEVMTPADWLLNVLAVYFHDAGMVVTKAEFDARNESDFADFCETQLFSGRDGKEYRDKVERLGSEADLFLYEEFVRHNHADRIADWVLGKGNRRLGVSQQVADAVDQALDPLPVEFRRDLAIVCQSHHLNDLDDVGKYRVSQPYGNSDNETANVQYAALLLRTADLLHVTSGRAPALMYRIIDPQDPVSQREWAKQQAVRRVRPQKGKDADGRVNDQAPRDTVEVFATFDNPDGFFGLTSYLHYAGRELSQSYSWARESAERYDLRYQFPWRRIDDSEVTATGFLPQKLGFSLDQDKILDLLTGHTLYNDTSVVIRELVQNALDACRLQAVIEGRRPEEQRIEVCWDSSERVLSIRDDGTGMSQAVIENNLLKAGASRYQEDSFRTAYPGFSPISRFGIGVLSAFMIADSVTVTTCSPEEKEARQLTLRSVRGRYLVELLDKENDPRAQRLGLHGTEVKLTLRASAELPSILSTLKRWIVVPECVVVARIDEEDPVEIGFRSPGEALRAVLNALEYDVAPTDEDKEKSGREGRIRVIEHDDDGTATAFAVTWSPYFREWSFIDAPSSERMNAQDLRLGTCVEGIRVEDVTPGYETTRILSLCNAVGPASPKTNVARSGLEATPERTELLRKIYAAYLHHVVTETHELVAERGMSLTWAAQEASILIRPLLESERARTYLNDDEPVRFIDRATFDRELARQPLLLIESEEAREMKSPEDLRESPIVWTVDSEFVRAAERLLREVGSTATLASLAAGLGTEAFRLPDGPTFMSSGGIRSALARSVLRRREVGQVALRRDERRIDLGWTLRDDAGAAWILAGRQGDGSAGMWIARTNPEITGRDGEVAIRAHGGFYLFADSALAKYLVKEHDAAQGDPLRDPRFFYSCNFAEQFLTRWIRPESVGDFVDEAIEGRGLNRRRLSVTQINRDDLVSALEATPSRVFDTWAWRRTKGE